MGHKPSEVYQNVIQGHSQKGIVCSSQESLAWDRQPLGSSQAVIVLRHDVTVIKNEVKFGLLRWSGKTPHAGCKIETYSGFNIKDKTPQQLFTYVTGSWLFGQLT